MATLNSINCADNTRNVGFGGCVPDIKLIKGALLYDNARVFSDEELQDIQTTLQDDAWSDNAAARMYPIHGFVGITDNSEAPVTQTFDYGAQYIVRDGFYNWSAQATDGGLCRNSALRTHNGKRWVLFYDAEGKVIGYNKSGQFAAIPLQFFYQQPMTLPTGSATAGYISQFSFDPKYFNEDVAFVKEDGVDPADIDGLQDIQIKVNSFNDATGLANVTLQTLCGATNLYSTYSAQLGVVAAFLATNKLTGGTITITTVTPVAGTGTFDIQFNVADPDYPSDGFVRLKLVAPSALDALNVPGFDSVAVDLEVSGS